jgi:glycine/D-amino acid oxidase-like deaminating enzyme
MADYEVAVVGAGVHGASTAYHLAKRGLRTVVLERGHPADGPTTGRSSAICRAFYTNEFLAQVAQESMVVLDDFATSVGGVSGFRRTGALFLHGSDEVADVEATARALHGRGIAIDLLSPADLALEHSTVDRRGVAVAVWEPGAGYADPVLTTTSYLDAARSLGVVVRVKTGLVSIEPGSPVALRTTADEVVTAERVLIAAGPWTGALVRTFGVELATHAERHVVASLRCGDAGPRYVVADTVTGWYGKPDLGGLYLVGGLTPEPEIDPDVLNERVGEEEVLRYAGMLVGRFPALENCALADGWAGVYDVSPDWQPVIGAVAPNVVVDCGSSGHGFKLAPVLGKYVAALVAGDDVQELRQFHPDRFVWGNSLPAGFGDAHILG